MKLAISTTNAFVVSTSFIYIGLGIVIIEGVLYLYKKVGLDIMKRIDKFKNKFSKVSWYDSTLRKEYLSFISFLSVVVTIISFFGFGSSKELNYLYIGIFIFVLVIIYIGMWYKANQLKYVNLRINQTRVKVSVGDIFKINENEINVIAVNDFFDLIVDNRIVAEASLHGQFIKKVKSKKIGTIKELNEAIKKDKKLNISGNKEEVKSRKKGRKVRYKIGSILEYKSFVLAAFTKFNEIDKAYLSAQEYLEFWMKFWENIDDIYAGRTINIPLIGAGITRFKNGKPSKQELLEIMIWTLKISGFHNTYGNKSINIIIYEPDAEEIDFYHIKHNLNFKNK